MKIKFIAYTLFMLSAMQSISQTPMARMANAIAAGNADESARLLKNDYALILRQYHGQFYASVDGKVYDMRQSGEMKDGDVQYANDVVVVITYGLSDIAIKNYDGKDATAGRHISCCAIRVGTYDWNGVPLELWDCGTPYVPKPQTPEQIAAAKEAAKIASDRAHQKYLTGETNTVRFLISEVTNGDASAQCDLADHYLNGVGCETNRDLAVYWFTQAANQGDMEASNKLASLQK
jgi:hypothetical protein